MPLVATTASTQMRLPSRSRRMSGPGLGHDKIEPCRFADSCNAQVRYISEGNPVDLAPAVESAIHEIDTRLPVFDVRPMRESTQMASSFAIIQSALEGYSR